MKYIKLEGDSSENIKFYVASINRIQVPNLINELTNYYILHSFLKAIDSINKCNIDIFKLSEEDQNFNTLVDQIKNDLTAIESITIVPLEELIVQFPKRGNEFFEKLSDADRGHMSIFFDLVIKELVMGKRGTNTL